MEYDVFISYSRKDSEIVNQFVKKLTDTGYKVWIDREGIYSGDQFKAVIAKAIKSSSLVVFISSANSNASEWTVKEIGYALKKGKTIIPVKLDDTEYEDSIDFDLINIDFIQHESNQTAATISRLTESITKHIGPPSHTPKGPKVSLPNEELVDIGDTYMDSEDYENATRLFKTSAEQGYPEAQWRLGFCFENGLGLPQNDQEAVKWYRNAAENGSPEGQRKLGNCYECGIGVPKDDLEAEKWFLKAAEQGNVLAQWGLGLRYEKQDFKKAIKWYQKAAEQGHPLAQYSLGHCYYYGEVVPQDYQEAAKWFQKAAEQGLDDGQWNLGICYDLGQGVPQDFKMAANLYRLAAEQEHDHAQWSLGVCYELGRGVIQDFKEAVKWYSKAAEHENEFAQFDLGKCYENGQGVPQDKQEAIKWYKLAADQGFEDAIEALKRLNAW